MKDLAALNKYFYKYKSSLLWGVFFVTLSNLFAVFPAQSVRLAIDMVKENLSIYMLFNQSDISNVVYEKVGFILICFTAFIILLALIRGLFMYLMRQSIIVMSRHIEYDLKNEIYNHYQELNVSFYRKNSTGDLMARISEDVSRVRMYVGPAIMYAINLVVTILLVMWAMFTVNATLSFYVILPLPLLSFAIFKVNNIINKRSDAIQKKLSEVTTFVQEAFSGIRVLKAFAVENKMYKEFENITDEYKQKQLELAKVDAFFFPLMFFLTGLSTVLTIFVGGFEVINGHATIGNIAEFVIYVNMLMWPVASLGFTTSLIQRAAASQARINEFLKTKPEIVNNNFGEFTFKNSIVFKNVTFTYPEKNIPAIQNISFKLQKGKKLGIIGSTGSGKTTIATLLLRLFEPNEGEILIDEKNIKYINLKAFREQTGYVPQDVFLFSDSIENNIKFGKQNALQNEIEISAEWADVKSNIEEFPEKYKTLLGERGVTLSGGQKQRVAIARALIKNPDILILDDCLSAVDTKTEAKILQNLEMLLKDKTAVIISHRISSVKNTDHIIVLDKGKIVERGSHNELINLNGIYSEMFEKQLSEELIKN
ncbi:MAG: ABC transporter ATP-binding protein [Bacteroidia bacterium]